MNRTFLAVIASLVLVAAVSARQQPVRDAGIPEHGTGRISGTVVLDDSGAPLRRVAVSLTGGGLGPGMLSLTNDAGQFEFADLPAGTFTLRASKEGYVPTAYGQKVPDRGTPTPIALAVGQRILNMQLTLSRGAVIEGTIRDPQGQPLHQVPVLVMQHRTINGERVLWSLGQQSNGTDTQGRYRLYGLAPGVYLIYAYRPGLYNWFPGRSEGRFDPGDGDGAMGGAGPGIREVTAAEIQWALQQLQTTAGLASSPPPAARASRTTYGPTFYPGTADPAAAGEITLGRGEERQGLDFTIVRQSSARIAGQVLSPNGQPAANVGIYLQTGNTSAGGGRIANGRFSWEGQAPGRYRVLARATDQNLWAMQDVTLSGDDVELTLTLAPGLGFSGNVAFDAMKLAPPPDLTAVRLTLRGSSVGPAGQVQIPVKSDGTFSVSTVIPGRYSLAAVVPAAAGQSPGAGAWSIKSIVVSGNDVGDDQLAIEPGRSPSDVVVTLTDRTVELTGTLLDTADRPAGGYYIVLFSTDKNYWTRTGKRRPAPVRTATDGAFRFAGLPAGNYHLVALTDFDPQDLDAVFLSDLASRAITVSLQDGDRKVQNLKIGVNK